MLSLRYPPSIISRRLELSEVSRNLDGLVVCGARGPRPRFPRVWKTQKRIGTISKSQKLVECIKGLSNVKEEVYGALDSFIAWELEFPLIVVKKALKTLETDKEWKRIIQVTKWMLSKGQGKTMGSYYTLLNALAEDGRLEEAEELWLKIFSENLESLPRLFFSKMLSIYYSRGMHEKMFEVFADMEELGIKPDGLIIRMLGDVFQKLGMLDKYKKLKNKYPPPSWEYRYIKGKRVRIRVKQLHGSDEDANSSTGSQLHGSDEDVSSTIGIQLHGSDEDANSSIDSQLHGSDEDKSSSIGIQLHGSDEDANSSIDSQLHGSDEDSNSSIDSQLHGSDEDANSSIDSP